MRDQKPCEYGSLNCGFDDKHELSLVAEVLRTIDRYSKKNKLSACPSCLRDTMLSLAALLHLEAAKIEAARTGRLRSGKRLGDAFARAARSCLETVSHTKIFKIAPGRH
jgi:hypothetical protein